MPSQFTQNIEPRQGLLKIIKALTSMSGQMLFYGSALLAIASIGGASLPGILGTLATVGINVLSNMLERVARGEDIPDDEIRKTVEEVIHNSGIEKLATSNEFQRAIAHVFRQLDLLNFAIQRGEITIATMLSEQFAQYGEILHELQSELAFVRKQNAEILKNVQQIAEVRNAELESLSIDDFPHPYFPMALVDQKIEDEVDILRKSRFFEEYDRVNSALMLARKLIKGELFGGTDAIKSRALAWCARILSPTSEIDKADEYLKLAKGLGTGIEINIAQAFLYSQRGDKSAALKTLAKIDAPSSRSAAIMVVAHHDSPLGAIDWVKTAGIDAKELDADGKLFLLMYLLQLADWRAARETLAALTDEDLRESPVLNHMVAMTHLLSAVPDELRSVVINQLPFEAASFPLSSDQDAIDERRVAHRYFKVASTIAVQFNCHRAAAIDDDYALWLELKDPEKYHLGKQRLEAKLRDPNSSLRFVHLGLQFGISLDLNAVEREIEKQITIHGGNTPDTAIARFALAHTQKTPEDVANYIARYENELIKFIDKKSLKYFQIEMLARAMLLESANECLKDLIEEGLSEVEESRLRRIIAEVEGADPIEVRKAQFKKTDSLGDLAGLVDSLETKGDWDGICDYGQILFERTHSLQDAERFSYSLYNTQKYEQLLEFLNANRMIFTQSKNLKILYCWALYYEGALLDARSELVKLSDDRDNPNYRTLFINIGIALGDGLSLSKFVADELLMKDRRNGQELITTAQLALHVDSPFAKDLIKAAAEKGKGNAEVLASAYFLATYAGWEKEEEVTLWLHEAAALSGDDGPLQRKTLKDFLEWKSEWERKESETWQLSSQGALPMFLTAQYLNKSLLDLMLIPAIANGSEKDPRRRGAIPAYSGNRQPRILSTRGKIGIDATALLTLSLLNLLDVTLDSFDTVYVPHSTLGWLFEEKQKASFHQPSRIKDAHQIRHLLATGKIEKLLPSTLPDSKLSTQVGDELALLIAEAEKVNYNGDKQGIVVRSSPVHRIASLMEEEADLTNHAAVMSSCRAVVEKLRQIGQITAEEEKKASAYLLLQEKPWPNQPEIVDGAILYLDDITITYFLHLGILDRLQGAGFRTIVSPRKVSETNELIFYESISRLVYEVLERLRSAISTRIETGRVKVGRQQNIDDSEEGSFSRHPTVSLLSLASECDAIVVDDRFLNQHGFIEYGNATSPLYTTLDLLDMLVSSGSITTEDLFEYRTQLRRAGFFFIPLRDDELTTHLKSSMVKDFKVSEAAELKAIRENYLCIRMSSWLQLPKELPWLDISLKTFIRVMKDLWTDDADFSCVMVLSDWILDQIDVRGWAHRLGQEDGDKFVKIGRGAHILLVLTPPIECTKSVKDKYWNWVEERILIPIKEQDNDLYIWIVEWYKNYIGEVTKINLTKINKNIPKSPSIRSALALMILELAPPLIQKNLLEDLDFWKEYALRLDAELSIGDSGITFQRSNLFSAIRNLHSGLSEKLVSDTHGKRWKVKVLSNGEELPAFTLSRGKQSFALSNYPVLSQDLDTRLRYLDEMATDVNLPDDIRDAWSDILTERPLEDFEVGVFLSELKDTPIQVARSIRDEIMGGRGNISSLVPRSRMYFERLIGAYDGSPSIHEYATNRGKPLFDHLCSWRPYDGFLFCLLLSSHSSMTAEINVDRLGNADLLQAYHFLEKYGDRLSQLGAIEIGFRILPSRPEIEPLIIHLIKQILDDDADTHPNGFKILSTLFLLVDGELSRTRLFSAEPPFYRRLASLSQAALIHRQMLNFNIEFNQFCDWAYSYRGEQFYMQSLSDMRLEPRWSPDLVSASQLKADFLGRIMITAKQYEHNIKEGELYDLVLGTKPGSLYSLSNVFQQYLPGPLEGGEVSKILLPTEIAEAIEAQLRTEEVGPSSFIALVNLAMFVNVGADRAELAARSLKLSSYRLTNLENRSQLLALLNGLALVAAVTRSGMLADELRILVRRYMRDTQYALSIEEAMMVCLVSAASHADLIDWMDFACDWLTELAFGELDSDDGEILHSHLKCLCLTVPELWVSCGRATAALMAYNGSRHPA